MNVGQAKAAATRWVNGLGAAIPGFQGAYFAGSVCTLPGDAVLPASSDVDVMVVLDGEPPAKVGKLVYDGVLLEVTFLARSLFETPEEILGNYHLAASFAASELIADPTGTLTKVQAEVRRNFARRRWVEARCADARGKVEHGLRTMKPDRPLHDRVIGWVFPTGVLTHILLVAGLRNPTVRRRYEETLYLLQEYGRPDLHESLLGVLGCAGFSREQVERHLASLTRVFDEAAKVEGAPFPFASDINPVSRPIAIGGSQDLIARGLHREAVFWIVVTWSRSLAMLGHGGGPSAAEPYMGAYRELLGDLGVGSWPDLEERRDEALRLLPTVWAVAHEIMDMNPRISTYEGQTKAQCCASPNCGQSRNG